MTRDECMASRNDVEMIRHVEWWTLLRVLPLKRFVHGETEHAFLTADAPLRVYHGIMYTFAAFRGEQATEYPSPEAIVADGWMVD